MKHAKILIADDEAAITTGLSAILEDAGYAVDVVSDGQKALEALTAERATSTMPSGNAARRPSIAITT